MKRYLLMGVILYLPFVSAAWEIDENVTIEYSDTTFIWGYDNVNMSSLTFESPTGAPIINGYTLDIRSDFGHVTWTIINFSMPQKLVVYGNNTVDGTFRLAGMGGSYTVNGVFGSVDFTIQGPSATFIVPAGEQVITITPLGSLSSGPRIAISGEYSSLNRSITTAVTLSNSDGTAVTGAESLLVVKIFEPTTGTLIDMPTVHVTTVSGVYKTWSNISTNLTFGTWLVTGQYYSISTAQIVSVESAPISEDTNLELTTAFDIWVPIAIWGGLLIFCLWLRAWLPAVACVISIGVGLFTPPLIPFAGQVMLVIITLVLHVVVKYVRDIVHERKSGEEL